MPPHRLHALDTMKLATTDESKRYVSLAVVTRPTPHLDQRGATYQTHVSHKDGAILRLEVVRVA